MSPTNVRQAVAVREQQAAAAPAEVSQAAYIKDLIRKQSTAFASVLPQAVDPDRFSRLVINAVKSTPDLMRCFETEQGQTSVLLAAMNAAGMGLEPNTPTQDCWLIPRKNKGVWEGNLWLGYRGKQKLMRRSGNVASIWADVVYENDHFVWKRGFMEDVLEHEPADGDRGELTAVYAIVRYKDGAGFDAVRLTRTQVEKHRAMSDSWKNEKSRPFSPWTTWTEDQWKKTAIHALSKVADLSPEVVRDLATDEQPLRLTEDGVIEVAATDVPALVSGEAADREAAGGAAASSVPVPAPPTDEGCPECGAPQFSDGVCTECGVAS